MRRAAADKRWIISSISSRYRWKHYLEARQTSQFRSAAKVSTLHSRVSLQSSPTATPRFSIIIKYVSTDKRPKSGHRSRKSRVALCFQLNRPASRSKVDRRSTSREKRGIKIRNEKSPRASCARPLERHQTNKSKHGSEPDAIYREPRSCACGCDYRCRARRCHARARPHASTCCSDSDVAVSAEANTRNLL